MATAVDLEVRALENQVAATQTTIAEGVVSLQQVRIKLFILSPSPSLAFETVLNVCVCVCVSG
jgi:hypothetical protein